MQVGVGIWRAFSSFNRQRATLSFTSYGSHFFITQVVKLMKISLLFGALFALTVSQLHAQTPARTDVWGKSPPGSDDRFSNPKSKLYAGPDGYWNSGELRATSGAASYKFQGAFRVISGAVTAVKGLETLHFDFGAEGMPKPGVYKVGGKGNAAQNIVKLSFADVANQQIKEWRTADGAGTLTVSLVNGFAYFTARDVKLAPQDTISKTTDWKKPMALGFEGAIKLD